MEFQRMGVPNANWTLTNLNKDYQLCDTYPQCLFVPASVSTIVLVGSASFRSKGRLPVLTYLHKNQAALCRCSQPLSGFSARCVEDEQLLNGIVQSNPNAKFMYVVDTRPRVINVVVVIFHARRIDFFFSSSSADQRHGQQGGRQGLRERKLLREH